MYFEFDIHCDAHYNPAKSLIKIPLVCGEIKRQIALGGKLNQMT